MSGGIDKRLTAADFESFPDALKQRIALARCFIKEAPIFLLDNPAASLDTSSELHLIKKLSALKGLRNRRFHNVSAKPYAVGGPG